MSGAALKAVAPAKLPVKSLPTDIVEIEGMEIPIRSLSRAESLALHAVGSGPGDFEANAAAAEVYLLVHGAGVTEEEAKEWRENTDTLTVDRLLEAIVRLSGLDPMRGGAPAPDPKPSGSGPS